MSAEALGSCEVAEGQAGTGRMAYKAVPPMVAETFRNLPSTNHK